MSLPYILYFFTQLADSTDDYGTVSNTLTFAACQRSRCVDISIFDDLKVESEESFGIGLRRLSELDSRITINPSRATVTIIDDDGMYVLHSSLTVDAHTELTPYNIVLVCNDCVPTHFSISCFCTCGECSLPNLRRCWQLRSVCCNT